MIRAVAFDFDHTLYDRDKTYNNLVDDYIRYFSDYLRPELTRQRILEVLRACDRTGLYKSEHWEGIYGDTVASGIFAKTPTYEMYSDGFMKNHFFTTLELYDDTVDTLLRLREQGYKLAILSNGSPDYQYPKIRHLGLERYMDSVIASGELPHGKPHKSAFEAVAANVGCLPCETVYVGDNPVNDIEGSRQAGMTPVWIRSVGIWNDRLERPVYAIDRLGELPELLKKINV